MRNEKEFHNPVLLAESIEGLSIRESGIYVDVTYGGGGHSEEILSRLRKGVLVAFDRDEEAICRKGFKEGEWKDIKTNKMLVLNNNYRYLKNFLNYYGIEKVDGILADLGVSSHQIDKAERGFSTRFECKLDMRMDTRGKKTAIEVLNDYDQQKLQNIFKEFGEIDNASQLAMEITKYRSEKKIFTTADLKESISKCMRVENVNKYLAKVFQAIRIEVNDELESLKEFLMQTIELLNPGGRLCIISYHSLEDRLVKNLIKSGNLKGEIQKDFYGNTKNPFKQVNKKAIVAETEELNLNPRSRSAKLRIAERQTN